MKKKLIPIPKQHKLIAKFPTKIIFLLFTLYKYVIENKAVITCTAPIKKGTYYPKSLLNADVTKPI